ncbi:N-acetylmuramoyl-L-alanine amidase [Cytophagales bacterium LB-30]|uniref:N-acetylmuramoyl-L-alanine amidase n=1 Tax=Shiella aurantiaca TaxID=3058365 RepID=A0ABT8F908_9BACT|nr:N-acetylmuramoyl-L-alanine amidase [Shiella aurantiaca]MDN4166957.1 N-acetylmuramoyl-L-alanine amidase [Shiella aurantiaca]
MYRFFQLFVVLLLSQAAFSQTLSVQERNLRGDYFERIAIDVNASSARSYQVVNASHTFTALAFGIDRSADFGQSKVVLDKDTLLIRQEIHASEEVNEQLSQLLHFNSPQESVQLLLDPSAGKQVSLHFINGAYSHLADSPKRIKAENCEEPASIPQSEWRAGLPAPNYSRSFTQVEHVIVHHSAGSNSATDYQQVVRDIYIYHTQSNGWSDVGYNYLIAQDGTIFKGRDPLDGAQDNVIGAHFCGSNSQTMGICLLGNYETAQVSEATLGQLEDLITWKLKKEGLNPLASSAHPANSDLGVIAGHRNGCSTACPGENAYQLLQTIRENVADKLNACGEMPALQAAFSLSATELLEGDTLYLRDESQGAPDAYRWEVPGAEPELSFEVNPSFILPQAGSYSIRLEVSRQGVTSTIEQVNAVTVLPREEEEEEEVPLLIYPNPITGKYLRMEGVPSASIKSIYWVNAQGQVIASEVPEQEADILFISIEMLPQGVYILHVQTEDALIKRKALVY